MGCVFGKEASHRRREEVDVAKVEEVEFEVQIQNGESGKEGRQEEEEEEKGRRQRERRERWRSLKANPRFSNPPNYIHGEQVAAGWPSWLSKVAGEAIHGLMPRRADSFHKIDKVCRCLGLFSLSSFEFWRICCLFLAEPS